MDTRGARAWPVVIVSVLAGAAPLVPGRAVALDAGSIDRAELDDGELRVEGDGAVPGALVSVTSAESSASSVADDDGDFRVRTLNFRARDCRVTVTDGTDTVTVVLDECSQPPATTVPPPPTTASTTTIAPPTTTIALPTTTTAPATTVATSTTVATTTTVPPTTVATTTTVPPTTVATTTTVPPTTVATTTTVPPTTIPPPTTVPPTSVAFTDLVDLVPQRCFSAPLSTIEPVSVRIGIESGVNPATFQSRRCVAATTAFNPRSVSDTFTVTVTAPPGQHITAVSYLQAGSRFLERSLYWRASGSGELTAGDASVPFTFTTPTLTRTIDLAGQQLESVTVSVSIALSAGRSANNPRVTDPPGSASISVTSAILTVETA